MVPGYGKAYDRLSRRGPHGEGDPLANAAAIVRQRVIESPEFAEVKTAVIADIRAYFEAIPTDSDNAFTVAVKSEGGCTQIVRRIIAKHSVRKVFLSELLGESSYTNYIDDLDELVNIGKRAYRDKLAAQ